MSTTVLRHLRYAIRVLSRSPGFTITVVVTLALGIGASTAVFSAIDAILLRPLPYPQSDRLVRITEIHQDGVERLAGVNRVRDWHRLSSTFEGITAYYTGDGSDTTRDVPERTQYGVVAPNFFEVLGVRPALGRLFSEEEHRTEGPLAVVLGDAFWRRAGGDPNTIGSTTTVRDTGGDVTFSIVGVLPADFQFADPGIGSWSAARLNAPWMQGRDAGQSFWIAIGRLKPGVTLEQARADLALVQARLAAQYPQTDRGIEARIEPLKASIIGKAGNSLWLLFGAVSVLLLIACSNIAALMLARAARREQEVAIRYALGASRIAVSAQMLTEACVLALAGAALGLVVVLGASAAFKVLAPELPRLNEVTINGRILAYTLCSAVLVALLCGVFPAIRSARHHGSLSGFSTRTQVSARHSVQWLLVGVQVALCITLLAGAGLLVRSFEALARVDRGFEPSRVLAFRIYGNWAESADYDGVIRRINATLDALESLPGAEAAATSFVLPGVPGQNQQPYAIQDGRGDEESVVAETRFVSPSYFQTLQIALLTGELCRRPERAELSGPREVMINERFADRYFHGGQATGTLLTSRAPGQANGQPMRIVGVVADAREVGLDREPVPTVYPCTSAPTPLPWYLIRTRVEPTALASTLRLKLRELEPLRAVYDISPLSEQIGEAYAENRLRTVLLSLFAATALSLACLGVYATLSYAVSLRTREVGLRMALGSPAGRVVSHFLLQGMRVVVAGAVIGLVLSFAFTRTLSGMLYGVTPFDPVTLLAVVVIVVGVAALAALLPAMHASRIDPMLALRED